MGCHFLPRCIFLIQGLNQAPLHCRHILYHLSHLGCIQINEEEFIFITIIPSREGVYMLSRFSCVRLFATPWTVAQQAPLSMEFSRQEYWSGLPFLSPKDLSKPRLNPVLPHCRQILYHLSHQESKSQRSKFLIYSKDDFLKMVLFENWCG